MPISCVKKFLALCFIGALGASSAAQQPCTQLNSVKSLEDIHGKLFPQPIDNFPKIRYQISVEYGPYDNAETSIYVLDKFDHFEVVYARPMNTETPVFQQIKEVCSKSPSLTAEQIASRITVFRKRFTPKGKSFQQTMRQFSSLKSPINLPASLWIHGSTYRFEMITPSQKATFKLEGPPAQNLKNDTYPLIQWIASLKSAVEGELNLSNEAGGPHNQFVP